MRTGLYPAIHTALHRDSPVASQYARLGLFVYPPVQGWRLESIDNLKEYERLPAMPCKTEIKDNELYIDDRKVSDELLHGIVSRAVWSRDSSKIFVMSDWRVRIADIDNCQVKGTIKAWGLDAIVIGSDTEIFETENGLELVTRACNGIETVKIEYGFPP